MIYLNPVNKVEAIDFIQSYHYSKVMPSVSKHFLEISNENERLGIITLGYGTQPLGTIRKLFPQEGFTSSVYLEIGKMCFHPKFNKDKNTGSQIISALRKWMIENTECDFLYTLADGIVGKIGYVYQASNFLYGGFFWTDVYLGADGEKIHPRSTKELLKENAQFSNKEKLFWMTPDFCKFKGISRIRGKMFRYMMPLNKKSRKILLRHGWNTDFPKNEDLQWKIQRSKGIYEECAMPDFRLDVVNVNRKNVFAHKKVK
jgi:hypothetical protein